MWTGIWGKKPDEEPILDEECALVWNVLLQRETLVETARVTAGHDKVANETSTVGQLMGLALRRQKERRFASTPMEEPDDRQDS